MSAAQATGAISPVPPTSLEPVGGAVFSALAQGVRWGVGALVAALAVTVLLLPALTGSTALTVLTGSMQPALPPGTLVVVKPVDVKSIRTGDVVTYQLQPGRPAVVTHRVVGVQILADGSRELITRGDSNPVADPAPVRAAQVKGRVWYSLPLIGSLSLVLGQHQSLMLSLAGAGLLAYAALLLLSGLCRKVRHSRNP